MDTCLYGLDINRCLEFIVYQRVDRYREQSETYPEDTVVLGIQAEHNLINLKVRFSKRLLPRSQVLFQTPPRESSKKARYIGQSSFGASNQAKILPPS